MEVGSFLSFIAIDFEFSGHVTIAWSLYDVDSDAYWDSFLKDVFWNGWE